MFAATPLRNHTFWDISMILLLSLLHPARRALEEVKELSKQDALNPDVKRYFLKF
jgi:hypothetical protein